MSTFALLEQNESCLRGVAPTRSRSKSGQRAGVLRTFVGVGSILVFSGCFQLETNIVLHPDGSGTITERLNFSRKLLDLTQAAGANLALEPMLARERVLERMKGMGKDIRLVSHEVREGPMGSRESISVFAIPNLADFTYVCPFIVRDAWTRLPRLKTLIYPTMEDHSSWIYRAGLVCVEFRPEFAGQVIAATNLPPRTPLASQGYRDLRPVFQDLMDDLEIKITFESYAPIEVAFYGSGWRDSNARTRKVDLICFAPGRDMDSYGFPLLENEEVVVDFLRFDFNSPWILNTVREWAKNKTLSALHPGGGIYFRPSREYFQKFFEGKQLKTHRRGVIDARWEELGWVPGQTN
ncbi:MAG: hypothetical protein N2255_06805 [Kiritimatiellae bacterium]|nr:hypothetical protein [Kiritimatiellia bacterium]